MRSRLEYGSQLCLGANGKLLDKLQKLVNRSLRVFMRKSRYETVYAHRGQITTLSYKKKGSTFEADVYFAIEKNIEDTNLYGWNNMAYNIRSNLVLSMNCPRPKPEWFKRGVPVKVR